MKFCLEDGSCSSVTIQVFIEDEVYFALAMEFTKDVVPDQEEPHRTTGALLPKFNPRDESAPHVVGTIWVTGWNQIAEMPRNHGPLKSFIVTMEAFLRKGNPMCSGGVIIRQCIRIEKSYDQVPN